MTTHQSIWIIGGGRFGRRAARMLHADHAITIVDQHAPADDLAQLPGVTCIQAEAIDWLGAHLHSPDQGPSWILPMAPLHLAWRWLCIKLSPQFQVLPADCPPSALSQLPNPMAGATGEWFVSRADFICPTDCPEPADHCMVTGRPRGRSLYAALADMNWSPFRPLVIRSRQLAPGIGGYRPVELFRVLSQVKRRPGSYMLATACRCHGVAQAFRLLTHA